MLSDPLILFIVLAPGLVALTGIIHKQLGDRTVMFLTTATVGLAGILSLVQLFGFAFGEHGESHGAHVIHLMNWISVGSFQADWAIRVDALSITMMAVVTSVSGLVHLYSWGYMSEDPHRARFFAYLSLFTFAMLMLVVADNFIQLFFGWEGVGLASYLLIGFWYTKKAPNDAAIKAFVTNRVGDFGLALGIMAVFFVFGSVEFDVVLNAIRDNSFGEHGPISTLVTGADPLSASFSFLGYQLNALEITGVLLFIGAMGKSAQFFLHVWLPDAMEGPTPVSALIHAATMVTAGVYLVCLMSPLYEHTYYAAAMITLVGLVTALYAATVGLAQNDIKRVIAYSTCSQLGYMFFAAGVGAYDAAMFHLFTHAFFKALLFLGAGSVIHGMHHEQDMRNMGGVAKYMKVTYAAMLIGTIAIIGLGLPLSNFGFSGFFSKDAIIEAAYVTGQDGVPFAMLAFWAGLAAALLTSFYSFRLLFMTFHGPYTGSHHIHAHHDDHGHDAHADDAGHDDVHAHGDPHESPLVMLIPLVVLAIGAMFAGLIFYDPMWSHSKEFWGDAIYKLDSNHIYKDIKALKKDPASLWVFWAPIVVTVVGFLFAFFTYFFNRGVGKRIADSGGPLHGLFSNKWYFDELYNATVVKATRGLGDLFWKVGDKKIIDGLGPDGVSNATKWIAKKQSKMHTGYLYHYAFVIIGAALIFGGVLYARSGGLG